MVTPTNISVTTIWSVLKEIPDPEVPVLSITDLGIVRDVLLNEHGVEVVITPTYTGCPAMEMIATGIRIALGEKGFHHIKITTILSPAWTTDWMSEEGKLKLKEYGVAPPNPRQQVCNNELFAPQETVQCPRCNSWQTHLISQFGATACKALYQCDSCQETFDYFKCH